MVKTASNRINMLSGPLLSRMLLFALPLMASGILQQSFNSVDVAVVGRFTGSHALAAVGSTGPVLGLLVNLFIGMSVGVNVVIANYIGRGNGVGVRRAVSATVGLSLICSVVMVILGESLTRPVLELTGTPEAVLDDAVLYMRILVGGMPFMVIYNLGSAILRSVGDTRRPFYCLVIAGFINVGLNFLFVLGCGMGVSGVAWGTVLSNVFNAVIIIVLLTHEKGDIRVNLRTIHWEFAEMRKIFAIGMPAGLQGAVFALSNTVILSAINSYGASATAGSAAAINFEFYCFFPVSALGATAVAFISQNYGAGNYDRIRRVFRICLMLSFVVSLVLNLLSAWQAGLLLQIFTTDPEVIGFGITRMQTVLLFQFIASYYEIAGSAMRGLGHSMTPTVIVICGTCVLRLVWVALLPLFDAPFVALMAVYPVSWFVTNIGMAIAWRRIFGTALRQLQTGSDCENAGRGAAVI